MRIEIPDDEVTRNYLTLSVLGNILHKLAKENEGVLLIFITFLF